MSERGDHEGHQVKERVTEEEIEKPTRLVSPVDDRKSQAVSWFDLAELKIVCHPFFTSSNTCTPLLSNDLSK